VSIHAASVLHQGIFDASTIQSVAENLRHELGGPATCAFCFLTPDYLHRLEEFTEIVRVDGHIRDLVGTSAASLIGRGIEPEGEPGFTLLGVRMDEADVSVASFTAADLGTADVKATWWEKTGRRQAAGWILIADPFEIQVEDWIDEWNTAYPGARCAGGLASGAGNEQTTAVFHNGQMVNGAIAVGLDGPFSMLPLVTQGCRPIGEPLPVTKAEANVIYTLGSRPAYEALEAAFAGLGEEEKEVAQGNLFAGLAGNEYVEDFKAGDFLVRNIIGADPNSGAVVIGGYPRLGQTVQYQFRDKSSAVVEMKAELERIAARGDRFAASLLFSCLGRGKRFFGKPHHDASLVQELIGSHPSAGFFCSGEIGPVGAQTCIHGYSAAGMFFCEGEK